VLDCHSERREAKIMRERQRLSEIVVEAERAGERAGDLTDLERMGEPCAEMVPLVRNKDLCLMGEPAKSRAVNDTVTVTLKFRAGWRSWLRDQPATARGRIRGIRRPRRGQSESESGRNLADWHQIWLIHTIHTHSVAGVRFAAYVCTE
jgi:hypothetical protein